MCGHLPKRYLTSRMTNCPCSASRLCPSGLEPVGLITTFMQMLSERQAGHHVTQVVCKNYRETIIFEKIVGHHVTHVLYKHHQETNIFEKQPGHHVVQVLCEHHRGFVAPWPSSTSPWPFHPEGSVQDACSVRRVVNLPREGRHPPDPSLERVVSLQILGRGVNSGSLGGSSTSGSFSRADRQLPDPCLGRVSNLQTLLYGGSSASRSFSVEGRQPSDPFFGIVGIFCRWSQGWHTTRNLAFLGCYPVEKCNMRG